MNEATIRDILSKGESESVGKELTGKLKDIFDIIANHPDSTIPEIAKTTQLNRRSVERHISTLRKMGLIKREGGRKEGYWKINE